MPGWHEHRVKQHLNDKRPGEGGTRTLVNWDYSVCETCVKGGTGFSNVITLYGG